VATSAALGGVAVLALVLLWRQEKRAPDPLLPLPVLGEPSIWRANLCSALVSGAFVGSIAFLPIYFAAVRGLSPAASGLALLPLAAAAAIGAIISGRLLARTGRTMIWASVGLFAAAAVMTLVALTTGALPVSLMAGLLGLASVGLGASFPMVQVVVQAAAGRERLGAATASVQFIRSLGAATGTALMGTVLFGWLAAQGAGAGVGGDAAGLFVALVNQGPVALAGLTETAQATFRAQMTSAFGAAFLAAGIMLAAAGWLASRVPLQRV
jgi:predicted MFS family arabinose efflux permease